MFFFAHMWMLSSIVLGHEPNAPIVCFLCTVFCLWASNNIIVLLCAALILLRRVLSKTSMFVKNVYLLCVFFTQQSRGRQPQRLGLHGMFPTAIQYSWVSALHLA